MKNLIRSNSCGSEIFISTIHRSDCLPISLQKSSSSKSGIAKLKGEIQGVKWYDTITGGSSLLSTRSLSNYLSVNYKFIYGKKVDYKKGYLINLNYIQKAVEEYCRVWSKLDDDSCIIHGDFSMDNLIFLDKGVAIIDWEHFSLKGMPKGFDALNLIYEQLYIFLRYKNLNKQIVDSLNKEIIIMHPGPINRGVEITSEVADSDQAIILDQVENGVAIRMAVMYLLASKLY